MIGSKSTDRHWEAWGARDPYFGVLTASEFRSDTIADNRDVFFASGETHIDGVTRAYARAFQPLGEGRALDFGCGVGRLAIPLAKRFRDVVGLDVSKSMIAEAERNAVAFDVNNIIFEQTDNPSRAITGTFDFVHTYIVLQHVAVTRGMAIIEKMLSAVKPGGGAFIHISVARESNFLRQMAYRIRQYIPGAHFLFNFLQGRVITEPAMQMNEYSLPEILRLHIRLGFTSSMAFYEQNSGTLSVGLLSCRSDNGS